jgi:excisionase family DNA binding protein
VAAEPQACREAAAGDPGGSWAEPASVGCGQLPDARGDSNLETGKRAPYATTVRALAWALGVEPARFIARDKIGLTLLTVAEAANRLDVPAGRVQAWLRQGLLAGSKVSGQWRVPAVVIAELARSGRLRGRSRRLDPRYRG